MRDRNDVYSRIDFLDESIVKKRPAKFEVIKLEDDENNKRIKL